MIPEQVVRYGDENTIGVVPTLEDIRQCLDYFEKRPFDNPVSERISKGFMHS
jgi:hypothetical protein